MARATDREDSTVRISSAWEKVFRLDALNAYTYDLLCMARPRRLLVLIADDVKDTREMYTLYLDMIGYAVETAVDGYEAVVKARALQPDIIVMDLQMPRADGWMAIKALQEDTNTAAIPVIAITGHDFGATLKPAALAIGVVSYLIKPCLPERLAKEISQRLSQRTGLGHRGERDVAGPASSAR